MRVSYHLDKKASCRTGSRHGPRLADTRRHPAAGQLTKPHGVKYEIVRMDCTRSNHVGGVARLGELVWPLALDARLHSTETGPAKV